MGGKKESPAQAQILPQQSAMQSNIMNNLEGSQGRSNQVFDAAFGGYQNLLGNLQSGSFGGGGGGGGGGANLAGIAALSGPGNPWAGQLGRDIRTREMSVLPGFYDRIKAEQTRLQNIQGGYNPGFTSQMAKLAREQAQQGQEAVLNTEIKLGEKSAQAAAANAAFNLQKQGMMANLAQRARAGSAASAAQLAQLQLQTLGGLSNLRTDVPGEVGMYLQAGLGNMGQLGAMGQGPQGPSGMDRVMQGAAVAAPVIIAL